MAKRDHVIGGGNAFEDLERARPAEALAKAELARKIGMLITMRGLTQAAAAEVLQIDQPRFRRWSGGGSPGSRFIASSGSSCCSGATSRSW